MSGIGPRGENDSREPVALYPPRCSRASLRVRARSLSWSPRRSSKKEGGLVAAVKSALREVLAENLRGRVGDAEFLTLQEAGRIACTSKNTIRNWIKRGKLKAITIDRIVRVRRDELEALMTKGDSGDDRPTVDTQADDILAKLKVKPSRKKG